MAIIREFTSQALSDLSFVAHCGDVQGGQVGGEFAAGRRNTAAQGAGTLARKTHLVEGHTDRFLVDSQLLGFGLLRLGGDLLSEGGTFAAMLRGAQSAETQAGSALEARKSARRPKSPARAGALTMLPTPGVCARMETCSTAQY